jgi:uncharacterized membrane protein YphA (DoxX/SURF4 family)
MARITMHMRLMLFIGGLANNVCTYASACSGKSSKSITVALYVRGYTKVSGERTVTGVQRLFSMFPLGLPGFALLLLRVSVALTVLVCVYTREQDAAAWLLAAAWVPALLLVVGFLTPFVAVIAVAAELLSLSSLTGPLASFIGVSALNALALALLGPGAYSVDASRFGRRVVDLPSDDDE